MYKRYIKRPFDILCALMALIVFGWLYILVAVLVRIKLGTPVIFKQRRPGKNEKIFTLYKFRTMTDARDEDGQLIPDDLRLTALGKFLRSSSLDELPEAWNILRGDMSVVGPRPLLIEYLPLYSPEQTRRHNERPGLTGYAQVNGRNAINWEEKFALDCWYIDNVNFWMDVKIILTTVVRAVKRQGITSDTSETMEPFVGSSEIREIVRR